MLKILCIVAGVNPDNVVTFDKVTDSSGAIFRLHMKSRDIRYITYDDLFLFIYKKLKVFDNE